MGLVILSALCCMVIHHTFYHFLDGQAPNVSEKLCLFGCPGWIRNQVVVSDIGIALAYTCQTFLVAAIAISSMQLFWRRIRTRAITISQVDALMSVRVNPLSPSSFRALGASFNVLLLALLASSMSFLSIFTPGSIKVSNDFSRSQDCTVWNARNLTALPSFNDTQSNSTVDYSTQIVTVLSSGAYLPPVNPCASGSGEAVQCSYSLEFVGPGFECEDVTASSNETAFIAPISFPGFPTTINLFEAITPNQTSDLTMEISVQTWDVKRSAYQAVNCTGVQRSYSVVISHNTTSNIDVTATQPISTIHANTTSPLSTFAATYVDDLMNVLSGLVIQLQEGGSVDLTPIMMGNIGTFELDGNFTWRDNMTVALEEFAQNATLSLLSGQIFALNPEDPELLENKTTTCTYTYAAYDYIPYRLFVPYGIAIFVTVLCAVWGSIAISRNGVEESMDFSRFLRAVLNERMFDARYNLDRNTRVKSDGSAEGQITPL